MNIYGRALIRTCAISLLIPAGVGLMFFFASLSTPLWGILFIVAAGMVGIYANVLAGLRNKERDR